MEMAVKSLAGCCALLSIVSIGASFAAGTFNDQPASPRSLPGDNLPPFGMLDEQGKLIPTPNIPAELLHRGPNSPPESTAPGPNLSLATEAARAAVDACLKFGFLVGATVVDSAGEARAMLTADGSDGSHVFVAHRKALVALEFKMPSSQAHDAVEKDSSLLARVKPYMFVEGGAVPIMRGAQVIGAIGVSGAAGTVIGKQDEICAAAGLEKIRGKLK